MKKTTLWELFWTFFKIGLFTFGGGYAMLSVIERYALEQKKWLQTGEMLDLTVIAESTPGAIAVNCATYIGFTQRGVLGALCATLGLVLPSFTIICALFFVIDALKENVWFIAAFKGVQCCVVVLVVNAFIKMFRDAKIDLFGYAILAVIFAVSLFTEFSIILLLVCSAVFGAIVYFVFRKGKTDNAQNKEEL